MEGMDIVTKPLSIVLIALLTPLLSGLLYVVVPVLRSPVRLVNAEADEHVERARRLLSAFGENEERLSELVAQLAAQGVDVTLSGGEAERILEANRDVVEEMDEAMSARSRSVGARELEERYRAAGGTDDSPLVEPGGMGRNIAAIMRTARAGIQGRDRLIADNARLLDEALSEVSAALAVSRGGVDASQHGDAHRLKGVILSAQAGALEREAFRARLRAEGPRTELSGLSIEVARLEVEQELVARSRIGEQLDVLHAGADTIDRAVQDGRAKIRRLDEIISDMEARIEASQDRAEAARREMERLEKEGADLLDPQGSKLFGERYQRLSEEYGRHIAEAHRLQFGTLGSARIDDSGDYLSGAYVPAAADGQIVEQRGLVGHRHVRETAANEVEALSSSLAETRERIGELSGLMEEYAVAASGAAEALADRRARAAEVYATFEKQVNEADAILERAAGKVRSAIQAFRAAGSACTARARAAQEELGRLSTSAQERSVHRRVGEDRWLLGQSGNETAQARYLLGSILHGRFAAAAIDHETAVWAKRSLEIASADPSVFADRRDAAGVEGAQALRSASAEFERSSRDLGGNWTVSAEAAAAHYLLSLVEHPDHVETAIDNYEAAVDNMPSDGGPLTQAIIDRYEQLRNR